jgi:hypothetical protein
MTRRLSHRPHQSHPLGDTTAVSGAESTQRRDSIKAGADPTARSLSSAVLGLALIRDHQPPYLDRLILEAGCRHAAQSMRRALDPPGSISATSARVAVPAPGQPATHTPVHRPTIGQLRSVAGCDRGRPPDGPTLGSDSPRNIGAEDRLEAPGRRYWILKPTYGCSHPNQLLSGALNCTQNGTTSRERVRETPRPAIRSSSCR